MLFFLLFSSVTHICCSIDGLPVLAHLYVSPYWRLSSGYIALSQVFNCRLDFYLNINPSSYSYKPITLDYGANITPYWSYGGIIQTVVGNPYGVHSTFLACQESGQWRLYLQTGSDVPTGVTCVSTQLSNVW